MAKSYVNGSGRESRKNRMGEQLNQGGENGVAKKQKDEPFWMRSPDQILEGLFTGATVNVEEFCDTYFEKKPLHVKRRDKNFYGGDRERFGFKELIEVIKSNELEYRSNMKICKYADGMRTDMTIKNRIATVEEVEMLFNQGNSIQFFQPQRYSDSLCAIIGACEEFFGCLTGSSAYITPGENHQALAPHHDDVEVFMLQMEGTKHWKLYKPQVELAGECSADLPENELGEAIMEVTLEQGDMLYIPRGTIHHASSSNGTSVHVTISTYQHHTWGNFLEVALPLLLRRAFDSDVAFRQGLPRRFLDLMGSTREMESNSALGFKAKVLELIGKFAGYVTVQDLHKVADQVAEDFMANRLPPMEFSGGKLVDRSSQGKALGPCPLEEGRSFQIQDKNFVRVVIEADDENDGKDSNRLKQKIVVYHSLKNKREAHMGGSISAPNPYAGMMQAMMDQAGDEDEDEDEDDNEDGSGEENEDTGEEPEMEKNGEGDKAEENPGGSDDDEDDEDEDEEYEEDEDTLNSSGGFGSMLQMLQGGNTGPQLAPSVSFPMELLQPIMKLVTVPGLLKVPDLLKTDDQVDETAVRGMLIKLWSAKVLHVQ